MEDQAKTIAFLASKQGFSAKSKGCETIATHISTVLLIGGRAIKLKKPVHFPYVDFSTPERRLAACQAELRLNRRTAPGIYLGVHRITRADSGRLELNGSGRLVDGVIEMLRFDNRLLFDRLALAGRLTIEQMETLATAIARLHEIAEILPCDGAARFARILDGNRAALAGNPIFGPSEAAQVSELCEAHFQRASALLDRRARSGRVRRCHGDLHLRNICLIDGVPTLFDCLEFAEELATTDVLYDLAFVLMDLLHRKLPAHANVLFNRYLDITGDDEGVALLPLFMAVRAAIRAHVTASEACDTDLGSAWLRAEARSYLDLARDLLIERPVMLVAIGGYSGSGKSTVAARIAPEIGPPPGARVLSSDRIRKRLFGVEPTTPLGPEAYTAATSDLVYAAIARSAETVIAAGHAVVADAVFDRQAERDRLATIAEERKVAFRPLWLDAPADILVRRVEARRNDPSDAKADIVMAQVERQGAPSDWLKLCAAADIETVTRAARRATSSPPAGPYADLREDAHSAPHCHAADLHAFPRLGPAIAGS